MDLSTFSLREDYWDTFEVEDDDIEFLYHVLLEKETPLTSDELTAALVGERVKRERRNLEQERSAKGSIYLPKETYKVDQSLVFPALNWRDGQIVEIREGFNPDLGAFEVIRVDFDNGELREFASGMEDHFLNDPVEYIVEGSGLDLGAVMDEYEPAINAALEEHLRDNPDFVSIAGCWFPRGLLVDINTGHLNLAEAVLDMSGGGPLPTVELLEQVGLSTADNVNLTLFSLDLALQEDPRFDEVGPAGEVLWFLNRLEPEDVLKTPTVLRYRDVEHDRDELTPEMLDLESRLDDELSPIANGGKGASEVQFPIIYPHLRAGTLPLSAHIQHLFPTAYEAPRIRFILVDGEDDSKFPGWVVREQKYVYGLKDWYQSKEVIPGSLIRIRKGKIPGEVIVSCDSQRSTREWVRTVLVGSDGGIVFAMLKQIVSTTFDERMTIVVPDEESIDQVWEKLRKDRVPFEKIVLDIVRELAKLNPQNHVHASELYAALNIVRRTPPAPMLTTLAANPSFIHVGDLHFRYDDSD